MRLLTPPPPPLAAPVRILRPPCLRARAAQVAAVQLRGATSLSADLDVLAALGQHPRRENNCPKAIL